MTASTVDASPQERLLAHRKRLTPLQARRAEIVAELVDATAARQKAFTDGGDTVAAARRVHGLERDLGTIDEDISVVRGWIAEVEAEKQAQRLAREHEQALAEAHRVAQDAADWATRAVAVFTGPVPEMEPRVLLAIAGEAGLLLQRQIAAAGQLATVLGQLGRYAPPPTPAQFESALLEPVVSRLPTAPPLRGLFVLARAGKLSAVLRHLSGLLEAQGL